MIAAASMPRPPLKTRWASAAASPLAVLFAILSSRLGGDAEPLAEDAIARLVEQARAGDTGHAARCIGSTSTACFARCAGCCDATPMPRT